MGRFLVTGIHYLYTCTHCNLTLNPAILTSVRGTPGSFLVRLALCPSPAYELVTHPPRLPLSGVTRLPAAVLPARAARLAARPLPCRVCAHPSLRGALRGAEVGLHLPPWVAVSSVPSRGCGFGGWAVSCQEDALPWSWSLEPWDPGPTVTDRRCSIPATALGRAPVSSCLPTGAALVPGLRGGRCRFPSHL